MASKTSGVSFAKFSNFLILEIRHRNLKSLNCLGVQVKLLLCISEEGRPLVEDDDDDDDDDDDENPTADIILLLFFNFFVIF